MAERRRDDIVNALLTKGFDQKSGDHFFFHYIENRAIFTKLSHGSKYNTYQQPLLSKIKRQLKLSSNQQLLDFIDCPLTDKDYKNILQKNKLIR